MQLQHDAAEKTKERTATLRREVYLRTVEELVKVNTHLVGLPQLDLTKINLGDGLQGFNSAAARLQLVAEPKTAAIVNQLQAEYGELVFDLMIHLMPASNAKTDIQIADEMYLKTQMEVTRILSEMTKQNESGTPDLRTFEALQTNLAFQQTQADKFSEERNAGWIRFTESNFAFQRFLISKLRDINTKHIPVLIAIRQDLGLTGNLDEIEAQMKAQGQRMESKFDELISFFKANESAIQPTPQQQIR
ncbi:hypothetical protein GCM10027046_14990 [Uliginosibacterium flavum]